MRVSNNNQNNQLKKIWTHANKKSPQKNNNSL